MRNKNLLFFSTLLFTIFLIFTFLVHLNIFRGFDLKFTIFLQKLISRRFDTAFSLFSIFGSAEIVLLIILILWNLYKKMSYFFILFLFGLFHVIEFLGKYFVNHPSPPLKFLRYDIPFSFPSSAISTGSSYPSGHVGRAFFLLAIVFYVIYKSNAIQKIEKKFLYIFLFLIIFIMFFSRIYLGEHWLTDVIGGALLGSSIGLISLLVL